MTPNKIGDITESKVIAFCIELGYKVSVPFGDYRYDLIVDDDKKLYKVQIKTARIEGEGDVITIPLCSSNDKRPYENEIDFIMAYSSDLNKFYKINHNDFKNTTQIRLRLFMPKRNQIKNVKWAENFEIKSDINQTKKDLFF